VSPSTLPSARAKKCPRLSKKLCPRQYTSTGFVPVTVNAGSPDASGCVDPDPDPDSDCASVTHHSGSEPDLSSDPDSVSDSDRTGIGDTATLALAADDERNVRLCISTNKIN
jgi:hypothetical protein